MPSNPYEWSLGPNTIIGYGMTPSEAGTIFAHGRWGRKYQPTTSEVSEAAAVLRAQPTALSGPFRSPVGEGPNVLLLGLAVAVGFFLGRSK